MNFLCGLFFLHKRSCVQIICCQCFAGLCQQYISHLVNPRDLSCFFFFKPSCFSINLYLVLIAIIVSVLSSLQADIGDLLCPDLRSDMELFLLPSKINLALSGQRSDYLPPLTPTHVLPLSFYKSPHFLLSFPTFLLPPYAHFHWFPQSPGSSEMNGIIINHTLLIGSFHS